MTWGLHVPLAIGFVLAGSLDYGLETPNGEIICVRPPPKTLMTVEQLCDRAKDFMYHGRFLGIPEGTAGRCIPYPGCIPTNEDCIRGFNCGENR